MRRALRAFLVIALTLGPLAPSSAPADPLGLGGFGTMAVDGVNRQVFASGGGGTTGIAVFGYDGHLKKKLDGFAGPLGMAVEGSSLFVANYDGETIDRLDTASLQVVESFDLGNLTRPSELVVLNGIVWFVAGECMGQQQQQIAYLDPETGLSGVAADSNTTRMPCHHLEASPAHADVLYAWDSSFADVHKYSVRDSTLLLPPSLELEASQTMEGSFNEVEVSPAGDRLLVVGYGWRMRELDANLAQVNEYVVHEYTVHSAAAAYHPDGRRIAIDKGEWNGEITIFRPGETQSFAHIVFGRAIARQGLEYSPDGKHLFVVSTGMDGAPPLHFDSISGIKVDTELLLGTNLTYPYVEYGRPVRLTASLAAGQRATPVEFYARVGGERALIGRSNLDGDGKATLKFAPARNMTFEAVWVGDDDYRPATSLHPYPIEVGVRLLGRMSGHYGKSGKFKLARRGSNVAYVVGAVPPHPKQVMEFFIQRKLDDEWVSTGTAVVEMNKHGAGVRLGSLPRGTFGIHARLPSHGDHAAGVTKMQYFKVTP